MHDARSITVEKHSTESMAAERHSAGGMTAERHSARSRWQKSTAQSRQSQKGTGIHMNKQNQKSQKNIFIEGIQGTGKSTLLQAIAEKCPDLHVCREGDYSPLELAWCTWMTESEYQEAFSRYSAIEKELQDHTFREGSHYIVTYTKIITDIPGFHKDLERFEIYNGRKTLQELEDIVLTRYRQFSGTGYLSECAFLQNIVEDLILFHGLTDDEIIAFYRRLYAEIDREHFLLLYLYGEDLAESTRIISRERTDTQGNPWWYPQVLEYLENSPYGKAHGYHGFDDLIAHLSHRQQVELRILKEVVKDNAVIFPSKKWNPEEVLRLLG